MGTLGYSGLPLSQQYFNKIQNKVKIDSKTAEKPKPKQWIENYFVQAAAYACMFYELTNIPVKKLVIIMTCENGEVVVYEEYDKKLYMEKLVQYIQKFVEDKLNELKE